MGSTPDTGRTLLAYSVTFPDAVDPSTLLRQLEISLSTLRTHSPTLDVVVFCHGDSPSALLDLCAAHHATVYPERPYESRLQTLCPRGWTALARYPLLHKFLNFDALLGSDVTRLLCCDCDTIFLGDVAELLARYDGGADLFAREEVHSIRSAYGHDPSFVDEALLARIAHREGGASVPPFNLGFVLIERVERREWAALQPLFVDYAWRLVGGMALDPLGANPPHAEFAGLAEARTAMDAHDIARALPFPSTNRWLLDEVALWLALGHFPGLRTADFSPADVAQNGEFEHARRDGSNCIACHYFSTGLGRIEAWLESARHPEASRY